MYPDEYAFFTKYGVNSLLCAPFSKRINHGFVGVDNPTRFQDDPTFLFIICYAIVLELNEIKMQQSMDATERNRGKNRKTVLPGHAVIGNKNERR